MILTYKEQQAPFYWIIHQSKHHTDHYQPSNRPIRIKGVHHHSNPPLYPCRAPRAWPHCRWRTAAVTSSTSTRTSQSQARMRQPGFMWQPIRTKSFQIGKIAFPLIISMFDLLNRIVLERKTDLLLKKLMKVHHKISIKWNPFPLFNNAFIHVN